MYLVFFRLSVYYVSVSLWHVLIFVLLLHSCIVAYACVLYLVGVHCHVVCFADVWVSGCVSPVYCGLRCAILCSISILCYHDWLCNAVVIMVVCCVLKMALILSMCCCVIQCLLTVR